MQRNHKKGYASYGDVSWLEPKLRSLLRISRLSYNRLFPGLVTYLKRELSGCNMVLDIGCGYNSPIQYCNVPFSVGVDVFEPYLQESKKRGIHTQHIKGDIARIEFKANSFDAVLALDVLEHFSKEEGWKLIKKMQRWAKSKVIVFTPNGFVEQDRYDNNPWQTHKSGWSLNELKSLGFQVYGVNGWKTLRGYKAQIRFKPTKFWWLISNITQMITYHYPQRAFQLLAIKQMGKDDKNDLSQAKQL